MTDYNSLNRVLQAALDRASIGKGHDRHATDAPFEQQGMSQRNRKYGTAFGLGQIDKKLEESVRLFERLELDAGINELLDVIVYAAGVVIVAQEQQQALQAVDGHPDVVNGEQPEPYWPNEETVKRFMTDEVRKRLYEDAIKNGMGFGFMDESGEISVIENDRVIVVRVHDAPHPTNNLPDEVVKAETHETYAEDQRLQPAGDFQRTPPVSYAFTLTEHAARAWDTVSELTADRLIKRAEYLINKNRLSRTEAAAFRKFAGAAFAAHVGFIGWDHFDGSVHHKAVSEPGWEKIARAADLLVADLLAGGNVFKDPSELLATV